MSKRWMRLVAIMLALLLVAAACGDSDEDSESGDTDAASEAAITVTDAWAAVGVEDRDLHFAADDGIGGPGAHDESAVRPGDQPRGRRAATEGGNQLR